MAILFEIGGYCINDQPSEEDKVLLYLIAILMKNKSLPYKTVRTWRAFKGQEHINSSNYNDEKIKTAVHRAEELHVDKTDVSTVFCHYGISTFEKIFEMLPEEI